VCKECTTEHWKFCSQRKECASELYGVRKNVPGGRTRVITNSKRSLKVVEHLGGKTVQRRHKETELLKVL
jgi:hypothetical protein